MYYMDPTREYDRSEEEPHCTCYQGSDPQLQDGPCAYCEHQWDVEQTYGPVPPEPTEGDTMPTTPPQVDLLLLAIHNADLNDEVLYRIAHCYANLQPGNRLSARYQVLAPLLVKATMELDVDRVNQITENLNYTPEVTA
jgi:hypothetical protein